MQNVDTEASGQKDGDPTGHMSPHAETEKGVVADDHRGDYLNVKEEILVSEAAMTIPPKEEAKKKSVEDIGAILHSIQACCRYYHCKGCVRKRHNRDSAS